MVAQFTDSLVEVLLTVIDSERCADFENGRRIPAAFIELAVNAPVQR
jgi:hypothetical protein